MEALIIKQFILTPIKKKAEHIQNISDLYNIVSIEDIITSPSIDDIREKLLGGYILIRLKKQFESRSICFNSCREYCSRKTVI